MDRKTLSILTVCFALFIFVPMVVQKIFPPIPAPLATNQVAIVTGSSSSNAVNVGLPSNSLTASTPMVASVIPTNFPDGKLTFHSAAAEELLTVTNGRSRYVFTSHGGGIQEVQLLGYPETVSRRRQKSHVTNDDWATLNAPQALPVFTILGDDAIQGDGIYALSAITNGVRAEKALVSGFTVVKDFQFSTNFLLNVTVRIQNRSRQPLTLAAQQWVAGTATPMSPLDDGSAELVVWYNGSKAANVTIPYFNTNTSSLFGLMSRTPLSEYLMGTNDVAWSSAQNQYFAFALIPAKPAQSVVVHMIDLPEPTAEDLQENPLAMRTVKGLQSALLFPAQIVAGGATWTNQFALYAGPKEYQTLAVLAVKYNDIDLAMNFGFFSAVSKALLLAMNWLHNHLALSYGLVIILITVIIKFIFWPLTKASARSAKRMAALQPQLKALQEKYKDEPQKFSQKQWEFYKKNKVNPLSGCLPMLLQVPVFIGFYGMLKTAIELRGATFLWMGDLSKPDTMFSFTLPLHFLGFNDVYFPVNPMPLLMGATLLWQASLAPVSPSMDASQQKIMKFMPLMMLFFMYRQPSGLALYWTVSNLLTVLQTKLTPVEPTPAAVTDVKATVVSVAPAAPKKRNN